MAVTERGISADHFVSEMVLTERGTSSGRVSERVPTEDGTSTDYFV
jgi:hypothetical protein